MNVKGIVSSIDVSANKAEVSLPEHGDIVTAMVPFYKQGAAELAAVGDFIILICFSADFNDSVIL